MLSYRAGNICFVYAIVSMLFYSAGIICFVYAIVVSMLFYSAGNICFVYSIVVLSLTLKMGWPWPIEGKSLPYCVYFYDVSVFCCSSCLFDCPQGLHILYFETLHALFADASTKVSCLLW